MLRGFIAMGSKLLGSMLMQPSTPFDHTCLSGIARELLPAGPRWPVFEARADNWGFGHALLDDAVGAAGGRQVHAGHGHHQAAVGGGGRGAVAGFVSAFERQLVLCTYVLVLPRLKQNDFSGLKLNFFRTR